MGQMAEPAVRLRIRLLLARPHSSSRPQWHWPQVHNDAWRYREKEIFADGCMVVEPCNHPQKFPFPGIAMHHYALGASAIEAYWKSVAWPGEGVFVGEPLAQPFAPLLQEISPGQFELKIFSPRSGQLQ